MNSIRKTAVLAIALITLISSDLMAQKRKSRSPKFDRSGVVELSYRKLREVKTEEQKKIFEAEYIAATMSFEYATRDDINITKNDWDVCLQGSGVKRQPYYLTPRTVTDDESQIWDLGKVDFQKVTMKSVKTGTAKAAKWDEEGRGHGLQPVVGHTYLIHTVDTHSDFWTKVKVTEVIPMDGITLEWELLTEPQRAMPYGKAPEGKKGAKTKKKRGRKER